MGAPIVWIFAYGVYLGGLIAMYAAQVGIVLRADTRRDAPETWILLARPIVWPIVVIATVIRAVLAVREVSG